MSKLLSLPRNYRMYTGHDYPPATRAGKPLPYTTVADQREGNRHVKDGTSEDEFAKWRSERDAELAEPKLINQALQFNIMAGHLPEVVGDGHRYFVPRTPAQTALRRRAIVTGGGWKGLTDQSYFSSTMNFTSPHFIGDPSHAFNIYHIVHSNILWKEAWSTISILKTVTMVILQTP